MAIFQYDALTTAGRLMKATVEAGLNKACGIASNGDISCHE
jgi:hypothetical protein